MKTKGGPSRAARGSTPVQLLVRVSKEMAAAVYNCADEHGITMSQVVRSALEKSLGKYLR